MLRAAVCALALLGSSRAAEVDIAGCSLASAGAKVESACPLEVQGVDVGGVGASVATLQATVATLSTQISTLTSQVSSLLSLTSSANAQSLQFDKFFHSGHTHDIFTVTGDNVGLVVVAKMEYVTLYAYAGHQHCAGTMVASTRRTYSGSQWSELNDIDTGHACQNSPSNSEFTMPNLFWDNGVLKLTTGGSVQCTAKFTITHHAVSTWAINNH